MLYRLERTLNIYLLCNCIEWITGYLSVVCRQSNSITLKISISNTWMF